MHCSRPRDEVFRLSSNHILPWVSFFLWHLLHRFLAIDDFLCPKGFCMVSQCICGQAAETFRHLFIDWPQVRLVWDHFQRILSIRDVAFLTLMLCFFIGVNVPFLVVIFKSFCLTSFCGKFGRPIMLLGLIPSLSLLMQLSIRWY